jgi:hypothetical protein
MPRTPERRKKQWLELGLMFGTCVTTALGVTYAIGATQATFVTHKVADETYMSKEMADERHRDSCERLIRIENKIDALTAAVRAPFPIEAERMFP